MFLALLILLCRCQAIQERENGVGEGKQEGRQGRVTGAAQSLQVLACCSCVTFAMTTF